MTSAKDVRPEKWINNPVVLFDNGVYSVIFGLYEGKPALGERWNGDKDELGFPNQAGNPIWHVVPKFLELSLLQGLLLEILKNPYSGNKSHIEAILRTIEDRVNPM